MDKSNGYEYIATRFIRIRGEDINATGTSYFNRKFDAIISWGLIFLLSKDAQVKVIQKASDTLRPGGKLLFTAPYQKTEWKDAMTGQPSKSLGVEKYKELLSASGLTLIEEFEDEGENHYFNAIKSKVIGS